MASRRGDSLISTCAEPRSYFVQTPNGTRLCSTRSHLRELLHDNPSKSVRNTTPSDIPRILHRQPDDEARGHDVWRDCSDCTIQKADHVPMYTDE